MCPFRGLWVPQGPLEGPQIVNVYIFKDFWNVQIVIYQTQYL